jgi:hypothetical protein
MRRWLILAVLLAASTAAANPADPAETLEPPTHPCKPPASNTPMWLTFRAETSIRDLATWLTVTYCKNVAIDSAVLKAGIAATVMAPSKLTPKQALQLALDAIEATGVTVVQKADTIIIKLGPNMSRPCVAVGGSAGPAGTGGPVATGGSAGTAAPAAEATAEAETDGDGLAQAMATGIKKLDDTHYEIRESLLEAMLLNPMAATRGVRIVPGLRNGKPEGMKLYAIRPSSLLARLGFANGDTVLGINKQRLDGVDAWLDAYTKLRDAKRLEVELVRRGQPLTLVFAIVH